MDSENKMLAIVWSALFISVAAVLTMLIASLNATSGHNRPYKTKRDIAVIQSIATACSNRPDTGTCIKTARFQY